MDWFAHFEFMGITHLALASCRHQSSEFHKQTLMRTQHSVRYIKPNRYDLILFHREHHCTLRIYGHNPCSCLHLALASCRHQSSEFDKQTLMRTQHSVRYIKPNRYDLILFHREHHNSFKLICHAPVRGSTQHRTMKAMGT